KPVKLNTVIARRSSIPGTRKTDSEFERGLRRLAPERPIGRSIQGRLALPLAAPGSRRFRIARGGRPVPRHLALDASASSGLRPPAPWRRKVIGGSGGRDDDLQPVEATEVAIETRDRCGMAGGQRCDVGIWNQVATGV